MLTRLSYFWRETMVSLRRNVLMTLAGIMTVTVSLALYGGILLLSRWVDHGTEKIKGGVTLEVFMKVDATDSQVAAVRENLDKEKPKVVKSYRFLDKDDAYEEFKKIFRRDPDLVNSITADDLPTSFRVVPARAELTNGIKTEFENQEGVDNAQTPGEALRGLLDATSKVRLIFSILSLVLLTSSLFLIVNTIRIATFARRREIEVMKLVGASNWFVRVPFMAEGLVQGVVGAGLAVGLVLGLKQFGFDRAFNSRGSFFSEFFVTGTDASVIAIYMLVIGALIGIIGATIGLFRFLRT